jgi:hypothetical protein
MNSAVNRSVAAPLLHGALVILLALAGWGMTSSRVEARSAEALAVQTAASARAQPAPRVLGSWTWISGNRGRMIQIATIGMIIGLFILMRK